jgi:uncharacterized membrane protein (DUF373 family)
MMPTDGAGTPGAGRQPEHHRPAHATGYIRGRLGTVVDRGASMAIAVIVNVLVVLMAVVLVWSVVILAFVIAETIRQRGADEIKDLVIGVLTIFIVIEIFDLFREYLRSARIKMVNLAEVSIAVVLRELWLLLLDGSENWQLYIALALVVAAVAGFWWLAVRQAHAGGDDHALTEPHPDHQS